MHQKLGRLDNAEADYTAAIAVAPDDSSRATAYILRRDFYEGLGRSKDALSDCTRAIELFERLGDIKLQAHSYVRAGRLRDAILLFERALE
jgi:tetratricopeptide (TPR) repeat protein